MSAQFPDFEKPDRFEGYVKKARFKFEVLGYFYENWAKRSIIGPHVDVWAAIGDADKRQSQKLAI